MRTNDADGEPVRPDVPVKEPPPAHGTMPDEADPDLPEAERRGRVGSAGGGPYTAGGTRTHPYEG